MQTFTTLTAQESMRSYNIQNGLNSYLDDYAATWDGGAVPSSVASRADQLFDNWIGEVVEQGQ